MELSFPRRDRCVGNVRESLGLTPAGGSKVTGVNATSETPTLFIKSGRP